MEHKNINYENAFNCKNCPQCNTSKGCPAWLEMIEEDDKGNKRIIKMCDRVYEKYFWINVTKALAILTENVSKTNNLYTDGIVAIGHAIQQHQNQQIPQHDIKMVR